MKDPDKIKPKNWTESVNCAIEGIIWSVRTQRHMRYHFWAAAAILLIALFFELSALELILLVLAITFVLFAELFNTAIEVLVDLVSPDYHLLARRAKDVAAGAVLVASIGAAVLGYLALSHHVFTPLEKGVRLFSQPAGGLVLTAALVVTIIVVLLKAHFGKGMPLHGGMPSGHAAVAFSVATSVALSQVDMIIIVLTFALAVMVSHSRLLMEIHTLGEVLAGALMGAGITLVVFWLFA
ncbi:MAG: phosphatase PAP2 family protein [Desulfuromonadales bacterium]|nr:phosphatase PAP2 family protein [Desulfuromonadales bacterium]NIS40064.1 phosphatase PAP2 family protein [Desulfuromonadales bacterium]